MLSNQAKDVTIYIVVAISGKSFSKAFTTNKIDRKFSPK